MIDSGWLQQHGRWFALGAGALLPLSFAPFGWFWLAVPLTALLIFVTDSQSWREAARRGFLYGLGAFATGTYWLYISIHGFGGAPSIVAVVLMVGLFALMASYVALAAAAAAKIHCRRKLPRYCLLWPALYTVFEWARGFFFTGFPWLALGYGQIDGPLAGWAPVGGVYLTSFVAVAMAGALLVVLLGSRIERIAATIVAVSLLVAGLLLTSVSWTEPAGPRLRVSMIQGSVAQDQKWRPEQLQPTLTLYRDLTLAATDADLVIWPEAAIPALADRVRPYLQQLSATAARRDLQIYAGVLTVDRDAGQYRNSLIGLGPYEGQYHKRHLVPFGEFFPVPDFARKWMRSNGMPSQDTLAGADDQPPLRVGDVLLAPTICYEDAYGAEQLGFFPDAQALINVSNDAWFGDSIAAHQHLQIARMRALETSRYMLRATNTGITAIIAPDGDIRQQLPQFETATLAGSIQPLRGVTPYARSGDWPVLVLSLFLAAAIAGLGRRADPGG